MGEHRRAGTESRLKLQGAPLAAGPVQPGSSPLPSEGHQRLQVAQARTARQGTAPTGTPVWGDRPSPARLPVRAPIDLVSVRLSNRARPMRNRVDRPRAVVQDDVTLMNLAHEAVAPILAAFLTLLRSVQIHAEICAVRDLKPEDLSRVVVPPPDRKVASHHSSRFSGLSRGRKHTNGQHGNRTDARFEPARSTHPSATPSDRSPTGERARRFRAIARGAASGRRC